MTNVFQFCFFAPFSGNCVNGCGCQIFLTQIPEKWDQKVESWGAGSLLDWKMRSKIGKSDQQMAWRRTPREIFSIDAVNAWKYCVEKLCRSGSKANSIDFVASWKVENSLQWSSVLHWINLLENNTKILSSFDFDNSPNDSPNLFRMDELKSEY